MTLMDEPDIGFRQVRNRMKPMKMNYFEGIFSLIMQFLAARLMQNSQSSEKGFPFEV